MRDLGSIDQYIQKGNPKGRIIAIGDIHGCLNTLMELISRLDLNPASDTLVFLGDYIDRGPFSCETVAYIRELQRNMNAICLRGNHEEFMIENECQHDFLWGYNGGFLTIESYEKNDVDPASDIKWMDSLPLVYETDEYIFCHAGLSSPKLSDNNPYDVLWERNWMRCGEIPEREKTVIFGHTPNRAGARVIKNGDLCIDGGCVFGGHLCAAIINGDDIAIAEIPIVEKDAEECVLT